MPVVGYLILLNKNLVTIENDFGHLFPHSPWRLLFIYYGFLSLSIAAIIYSMRCPIQIQKYPSPVEYMNSELEFLTPFFRANRLTDQMRDDLDRVTSRQKRILDIGTHQGELNSVSFFQHRTPQSDDDRRSYVEILLRWHWGLADTSRVTECYCCAIAYSVGFVLLLVPALCTFLEVTRYTIDHLFSLR
jgi:hypothetical protein